LIYLVVVLRIKLTIGLTHKLVMIIVRVLGLAINST